MAYTIIKSNGTVLCTIQDGTINTTSSSLGLPGRNFATYGQTLDTNFVRLLENFASTTVPSNPLRGQLWYKTDDNTLRVCPADNTNTASSWVVLTTATSAGNTTIGNVTVTGNTLTNNLTVTNSTSSNTITVQTATVSANLSAATANITTANLTTTRTTAITTGAATTAGAITGVWSFTGNSSANAVVISQGNIAFNSTFGIKCDNYMYANGTAFNPTGTYTNANVSDFLTGANSITQFTGNIAPTKVTTSTLAGGGNISGTWTLDAGAKIQATYSADLAERYAADDFYEPGTVVEIGGDKEITKVKRELSDDVFGVISDNSAYLMNSGAGDDITHPQVALVGRVRVNVIGSVIKGKRLVSAGDGKARMGKPNEITPFNCIGRALEHKHDEDEGTVLAVVMVN